MPLSTTVVGAFPKPAFLGTPDWFKSNIINGVNVYDVNDYTAYQEKHRGEEYEATVKRALQEVVSLQEELGITVLSDGEIRRENYLFHFCRHLKNMDFERPDKTSLRSGNAAMVSPVIRGRLEPLDEESWCAADWRQTQELAKAPVKYTIPGPMTITDSVSNQFYDKHREVLDDLRKCINREVRALAAAGCRHIQIDEPLLVRSPDIANDYGIDILAQCFEGVPDEVEKIVHFCCGYPNYLDEKDYGKAELDCYHQVANKVDSAGFDAVSIEDTHRRNDLSLFKKFTKTKIILGSIAIANSHVESKEEIEGHLREVLQYVPPERLIVAPDCGLGFLPQDIMVKKLTNMVAAAKALP